MSKSARIKAARRAAAALAAAASLSSGTPSPAAGGAAKPAPQAVATTGGSGPFLLGAFGSGYQAAGSSPARGYLYWPTTDTRRQMQTLTRTEILRRIQWLYAHFGFARRLVNGMARLLGFVTPQPNTSDEEWNELAFDAFMAVAASVEIHDRAGKFDFFMGQVQDNISIFRDGDGLAVLTETQQGRARLAYFESHQIANPPGETATYWVEGVRLDSGGKHMAYSLRDGEDPTKFSQVDARDAIYLGNFENRGQVRAISILTTAVLNMIDVVETRGYTKQGLKAHARIGTVVEQDMGNGMQPMGHSFAEGIQEVEATMPDGTVQRLTMDMVYNGAILPQLGPGQRVKVVADDRPTPNNMEFEKALLTDCCHAADLSYQTLCDISSVTGPGIRSLNAELKRWIFLKRYPQCKRAHRFYVYAIAKEMKGGRLRAPVLQPGETWWSKVEYIGLADMDIDGGRTASATLTDLRSGQTTWLDTWGAKGVFWKRRIRQSIAEVAYAIRECLMIANAYGLDPAQLTVERVFPDRFTATTFPMLPPGTAAPDAAVDTSDPADDGSETNDLP